MDRIQKKNTDIPLERWEYVARAFVLSRKQRSAHTIETELLRVFAAHPHRQLEQAHTPGNDMKSAIAHYQLMIEPVEVGGNTGYCAQRIEGISISQSNQFFEVLKREESVVNLVQLKPKIFPCSRCQSNLIIMEDQNKAYIFFQALSMIHPAIRIDMSHCSGCQKEHMFLANVTDGAPCECSGCGLQVLVFGATLYSDGAINFQSPSQALITAINAPAR